MTIDPTDCTIIIIPHDIDKNTTTVIDGVEMHEKFNGIRLRQGIHDAERIRLDRKFYQQSDLPEEKVG